MYYGYKRAQFMPEHVHVYQCDIMQCSMHSSVVYMGAAVHAFSNFIIICAD